ncbi:YmfL family putative regulatory protein [Serratia marcescens]|uniref:YmfL family putative regulatory protein n=1 Tax=Serratia marcescens TaxID=615 RepID=UPI00148C8B66|nr:YmfL family putative regulatory protein [Serratia marcescens]QJU40996.1 DNA-binding protein [Serratia marcescens]
MRNQSDWQAEKQPAWLVAAIRKTIAALPGGYAEAAEILDVTQDAIFNRLRTGGDQIFPMGWAMVLQQAAGTKHIADAFSHQSNSVNVPLVELDEVDNGDINQRLMESIEWIGKHSKYLRKATADGVIDEAERAQIEENSYQVMAKWQEHLTLLYRVFCAPERVTPKVAASGAGVRVNLCVEK